MVQLRASIRGVFQCEKYMFQFQYGSIKRKVEKISFNNTIMFQFQYGSIKSINIMAIVQNPLMFQFQYGSIKRKVEKISFNNTIMFQFQYGSIKRRSRRQTAY